MSTRYTDRNGCVHYPAIAAVPPVLYTRTQTPTQAWDAGANSVRQLLGDVRLAFSGVPPPVGSVIGLTVDRQAITNPQRMAFAWYLTLHASGSPHALCYEHGVITSAAYAYDESSVFAIERRGQQIFYWLDDVLRRRTVSTLPIDKAVSVGAALYGGYDRLPST